MKRRIRHSGRITKMVATFFAILVLFFTENAFAEYQWTFTNGCPESGEDNPPATFTATTNTSYSMSGTCTRTATHFTYFDVTSPGTPAPNRLQFPGLTMGSFLLIPAILPYETKPVVVLSAACPVNNKSLNWIIFQWKNTARLMLDSINLFGTATYNTSSGLQLDFAYDVTGALNLTGPVSMAGSSCANGSYTLSGSGDRGGTMYLTLSGAGYYQTVTEKSFYFLPQYTINAATDLGNKTMQGMTFNSTDPSTSVAYEVTTNAAGTTWTLDPYADVTTGALDPNYQETISISAVNSPQNGLMYGTITRTGSNAGSGRIACLMEKTVVTRVLCVGESPEDNTIPYSVAFTIEGPHVFGQASGTSTTTNGGINISEGVFNDGTHLLLADSSNNRVLIWNTIPTNNQVPPDLVLGQPNMQSSGANNGGRSDSSLSTPRSVYSDGTKVFVADTSNNRVLIWNSFPTSNQQAADLVLGQPSMTAGTANNGGRLATSMSAPYSVYADGTKLYVSDTTNNRILIWNTIPTTNRAAANVVLGQPNMTSGTANNGGRTAQSLNSPRFAMSDGTKLFVSDTTNNRVLIWNTIPTVNRTAANVVLGQPNMTSGTANNGGRLATTLSGLRGLHSTGSKLFVADTTNNRILIWNSIPTVNQTAASLVMGQPNMTSGTANNGGIGAGTLSSPRSVSVNGTKLFVADSSNYRVLMFDPVPTTNQPSAGLVQAQPNFTSSTANTNLLNEQTLNAPAGVHFDGTKFYIADTSNNRVLIWNTMPEEDLSGANVVLGQPDMFSSAANNGGISAQTLSSPTSVYSNGTKLFVSDTGNHRVLIWNTIPTTNQQAADVVLGQPNMTSSTLNNGGRSASTLNAPEHVSVSGTRLYVADTTNNRVLIWTTIPTVNQTAANLQLGQPNMTSGTANNGGRDNDSFSAPRAVHSDGTKVYVADTSNNRVLIWNTLPAANRALASVVLGQPNMTSGTANNGGRDSDSISAPYALYVANSKLFVSDSGNNRVMVWNTIPTVNRTAATVQFGQPSFATGTANNGGVTSQRMSAPRRIYADSTKFFLADSVNNRVLAFEVP